jgi:hypothetical protein
MMTIQDLFQERKFDSIFVNQLMKSIPLTSNKRNIQHYHTNQYRERICQNSISMHAKNPQEKNKKRWKFP